MAASGGRVIDTNQSFISKKTYISTSRFKLNMYKPTVAKHRLEVVNQV